jgi:hypothetical protein
MPLQDEERLFIEAIRDLNYQASRMQKEEKGSSSSSKLSCDDEAEQDKITDDIALSLAKAAMKAKMAHGNVPTSPKTSRNIAWIQDTFKLNKSESEEGDERDEREEALHSVGGDDSTDDDRGSLLARKSRRLNG